jgi:hypothetical protein
LSAESFYRLAADAILITHVLFVAFVVLGVAAIYLGLWLSWGWVRNPWFRLLHLGAIAVVVLQSWVGAVCPLTGLEMRLREFAGGERYEGSFVRHWLQAILYYDAPEWIFVFCYSLFGALVVATWFIVPPRRPG